MDLGHLVLEITKIPDIYESARHLYSNAARITSVTCEADIDALEAIVYKAGMTEITNPTNVNVSQIGSRVHVMKRYVDFSKEDYFI